MSNEYLTNFDPARVESPAFVVDLGALEANLRRVSEVRRRTGAQILMALKAFAVPATFPLMRQFLQGVCSSSPHESRLGRERFGLEVHCYSPAYSEGDMREQLDLSDHIVFNSLTQWERFKAVCLARPGKSFGLRVNPQHSETGVALYDPCAPGSRLGVTADELQGHDIQGIEGLHVHTLCQKGADALDRTASAFERQFSPWLKRMKWLNFGGGHAITRGDYDLDLLCSVIERFQKTYGLQVYLEPGETVAANTGSLFSTVLDVVSNSGVATAILDVSATCHMPDVLEMPYHAEVRGSLAPENAPWRCRLGGLSCLAGDVIGEYGFAAPLRPGDRLEFLDMIQYTMVKTTTFNGVRLPSIALYDPRADRVEVVRRFGYEDYLARLA